MDPNTSATFDMARYPRGWRWPAEYRPVTWCSNCRLDISQEGAGPEAEEIRFEPGIPQLLLHENQPDQGFLGLTDSAGGFESHLETRSSARIPEWLGP